MCKNIVICCDGTSRKLESSNTNVVRLFDVLDRSDSQRQICCYDPGVGTLPDPAALTAVAKRLTVLAGQATGYGLRHKITSLYEFLIDHYKEGDRVYLFGFSRGAFTVRALAGLLCRFGVLKPEHRNLVPYAWEMYQPHYELLSDRDALEHQKVVREFRRLFTQPLKEITFLGLWDTVKSYGYVWPQSLPHTRHNEKVKTVRHALALYERRAFFSPTNWGSLDTDPADRKINQHPEQDVQEVWFAGYHSDVGGGCKEEESGLARYSLKWMIDEARESARKSKEPELLVDECALERVMRQCGADKKTWYMSHDSMEWYWRFIERLCPRWDLENAPPPGQNTQFSKGWPKKKFKIGPTGPRSVKKSMRGGKVLVHESVPKYESSIGTVHNLDVDPSIVEYVGELWL